MRNKPWPYFDEWKIIFGKDRANGDSAEGIKKAVNELDAQEAMGNTNTSGEHSINVDKDDITGEENDTVSVFQEKGTKGLKQSGRKRKGDDSTDPTFHLLSKMHADTTESLKSVSSRIGYEIDLSNKRTNIVKILGGIPGLAQRDKFEAIRILLEKQEHLDVVFALPEFELLDYITYILDVFQNK
ncbi:uncharacterized protein LOC121771504 [Salvia splendens]|nr:uncharacterized protein LOC121771504 [Salvia splendens]